MLKKKLKENEKIIPPPFPSITTLPLLLLLSTILF